MAYPGGKNGAGVYQRIISLMPPHRVYIEPFLGGGAVWRLKLPAAVNIGLDLDPRVIAAWPRAGAGEFGGAAASALPTAKAFDVGFGDAAGGDGRSSGAGSGGSR